MEFIHLTEENLEREHICCAIASPRDVQVCSKKAWLRQRLAEGLVFLKGNVRGKCFIEYLPAEFAFAPIVADGYLYIDCLWVSGQWKGQGYATELLEACVRDGKAKGKEGLVILSSEKKRAFLSDHKFMAHHGFLLADTAAPYFELLYLPFSPSAVPPQFRPCVRAEAQQAMQSGFTLYYTSQCPFPAKYVPLLEQLARDKQVPFALMPLTTAEMAQNAPTPFTTFALYYNGAFVTHEILSPPKFEKLLAELCKPKEETKSRSTV